MHCVSPWSLDFSFIYHYEIDTDGRMITEYLDKTLINYANVMGLQADASITGDQFSQLAMIFYVTYLAFEFPHAYGMQTLPTAKYLGAMVVLVSPLLGRNSRSVS